MASLGIVWQRHSYVLIGIDALRNCEAGCRNAREMYSIVQPRQGDGMHGAAQQRQGEAMRRYGMVRQGMARIRHSIVVLF